MIIWLSGQHATTLANRLMEEGWVDFVVDEDEWNEVWEKKDPISHIERLQAAAVYLSEILGGDVAVACDSSNKKQLAAFKKRYEVFEVYLVDKGVSKSYSDQEKVLNLNISKISEKEAFRILTDTVDELYND